MGNFFRDLFQRHFPHKCDVFGNIYDNRGISG